MNQLRNNLHNVDEGFRHVHKEVNKKERTITHYISSGDSNRYGQVLPIDGFNENDYRKNPIVMFQHGVNDFFTTTPAKDQLDFIIGKNLWTKKADNYLQVKTQFAESDFANDVYEFNISGFLNAWSKYWFPISEPEFKDGFMTVKEWGIYEYSSVTVPVDANAVNDLEVNKNMMSAASSDLMKHFLSKHTIEKVATEDVKNLLKPLQDEIEQLKKNQIDFDKYKEEIQAEYRNEILNSLKIYDKHSHEKVLEIVGDQMLKRFNQIGLNDLDKLLRNKVAGAIREVTGQM